VLNSLLSTIIPVLEDFQRLIDVEGHTFLGLGMDRYAHFFLVFFVTSAFTFFRRQKLGMFFMLFLIFLKEIIDLGIVYYYEPIPARILLDSTIDFVIGLCGLVSAYFFFKFYRRIDPECSKS